MVFRLGISDLGLLIGVWDLILGIFYLECVILGFGTWDFAFGIKDFGLWDLECGMRDAGI